MAKYNKKEEDVKLNDRLPMIRINKSDKEDIEKAIVLMRDFGSDMTLTEFCRLAILNRAVHIIRAREEEEDDE